MKKRYRGKKHSYFVVTPYHPGPGGVLWPEIPTEGPCASRDSPPCKLNINHWRERSTGPCFPLIVMRCRSHKRAFTLYPPGHVPYGRVAVVAVAPDGSPARGGDRAEPFEATLFDASRDAAEGKAWHREYIGSAKRWWGTQLRRIVLAAKLLALAPQVPPRRREHTADILGLDNLLLAEQAQQLCAASGYQQRGAAVWRVLEAIARRSVLLPERLVECGTRAGLWGPAYRWLPQSATLRRHPFRATGTEYLPRPP
ncbi:MAG: hypothetical protein KAY24_02030 [Candidatus Eisenbacteria sp.]|nr:hypothetical protein [Candidatus Eisenbacteria bacterium]